MESTFTFNRVMIIDDTEMHRYVASYVMKKKNFAKEIIEFGMATDALDFLATNRNNPGVMPEIILLDIRMPLMDGFQFLDELTSKLPEILNQLICIVLISSTLDPTDQVRAEKNKAVKKFMNKPLDEAKLKEIHQLYTEAFITA